MTDWYFTFRKKSWDVSDTAAQNLLKWLSSPDSYVLSFSVFDVPWTTSFRSVRVTMSFKYLIFTLISSILFFSTLHDVDRSSDSPCTVVLMEVDRSDVDRVFTDLSLSLWNCTSLMVVRPHYVNKWDLELRFIIPKLCTSFLMFSVLTSLMCPLILLLS